MTEPTRPSAKPAIRNDRTDEPRGTPVGEKAQLLVVSSESRFIASIEAVVEQLRIHKPADFMNVVVRVAGTSLKEISAAIDGTTFFSLCDAAHVNAFLNARKKANVTVAYCVVVPSYDLATLDSVFVTDPFVRGVIKESIGDPEDLGQLAHLIKEERRNHATHRGEVPSKKLKWKIDASASPETGQLVSLFADRVMREFMQHLLHAVDSVSRDLPDPPMKPEEIWDCFRKLRYDASDDKKVLAATEKLRRYDPARTKSPGRGNPADGSNPEAILIEGETGVGKKIIAQWVARKLGRKLVRVSTVNIGRELLEVELFGTVHGGFTDAVGRPGQLMLAWGQVVMLDEIGDLPLELQAKLLVYLDDQEFQPVGWGESWKLRSPVYIVAATNRDLRREIEAGRFREDLYYRFRHRLHVPPLRERRSDLRPLIDLTLQQPGVNRDHRVEEISIAAIRRLEAYPFPGNVRELQSVLSEAVFRAHVGGRKIILEEDLPI